MKKKLFIIGCAGVPAKYGGFETYAENIGLGLSRTLEVSVICSTKYYAPGMRKEEWKTIKRIFYNLYPNGIQSLLYDCKGLCRAIRESDYILLLGVGSGMLLPLIPRLKSKHLLIHIDGLEWKRSKWNFFVRFYLWLSYLFSIRIADTIVLDNVTLTRFVPSRYQKKIMHINYGGDHLPVHIRNNFSPDVPYALVIARAEPENNLHLILKIFRQISNYKLIIISNWFQTRYGKNLHKLFSGTTHIKLIDAIYDNRKRLQQYRAKCSVYIHGHSAGGTNPSLVEAMYTGNPVIAWDNEFNRVTTNNSALYFKSEDELKKILKFTGPIELSDIARKLHNYARQHYTWNTATKKILAAIEQENRKPPFC